MAKDRFRQTNARNRRQTQRERSDRAAEELAEQGLYKCADCRQFHSVEAYQYVFKGEVKVARRCEFCRRWAREKRRGRTS